MNFTIFILSHSANNTFHSYTYNTFIPLLLHSYVRDSDESDEEMEVEGTTKPTTPTTPRCLSKTPKYDLMMTDEGKAKSSFFKQTKSFPMYHFKGEKIKWDEYGEPFRYDIRNYAYNNNNNNNNNGFIVSL